jgi:hypothetical protein
MVAKPAMGFGIWHVVRRSRLAAIPWRLLGGQFKDEEPTNPLRRAAGSNNQSSSPIAPDRADDSRFPDSFHAGGMWATAALGHNLPLPPK